MVTKLKNIKKSFGSTEVLKGIDLTIEDGDIYDFGLYQIDKSFYDKYNITISNPRAQFSIIPKIKLKADIIDISGQKISTVIKNSEIKKFGYCSLL